MHLSFAWPWLLLPIPILLALFLPLLLWRNHRLAYAATLCEILIAAVIICWITDWSRTQEADVFSRHLTSTEMSSYGVTLHSLHGEMSFSALRYISHEPWSLTLPGKTVPTEIYFPWNRDTANFLEATSLLSFDHWGFALQIGEISDRSESLQSAALTLPNWFLILLLSILPARWIYLRNHPRQKSPDEIPCPSCGYNLQGLPTPTRCPECGTPRPTNPNPKIKSRQPHPRPTPNHLPTS